MLVTSRDRLDLLGEELNSCNFLEHVVLVDARDELPADGDGYRVHAWSDLVAERADSDAPQVLSAVDYDMAARSCTPLEAPKAKGVVLSHRIRSSVPKVSAHTLQNRLRT